MMQGIGFQSLKKNPALLPLYFCLSVGVSMAVLMSIRSAWKNPDITWKRESNPEPWEDYRRKQFKLFSPVRDYSKTECHAPEYKTE